MSPLERRYRAAQGGVRLQRHRLVEDDALVIGARLNDHGAARRDLADRRRNHSVRSRGRAGSGRVAALRAGVHRQGLSHRNRQHRKYTRHAQ